MQILLRSTFRVSTKDDPSLLLSNALELEQSRLDFLDPEQALIWDFISSFVSDHSHAPDVSSVHLHFTQTSPNQDVLNVLQLLQDLHVITRGDFKKRLHAKIEIRRIKEVEELLTFGNLINRQGVAVDEGKDKRILKGYRDAIKYVFEKSQAIARPVSGTRKEGEVAEDIEHFIEDYDRRKKDPSFARGQLCGLSQIDNATGGARKSQLWTHAAFTGELKSTFAFNWMYNQAIRFGFGSCYFSLEMPYEQCQRIMYTMHSLHEKFIDVRLELGLQENPQVPKPLTYSYIRDGILPPHEEIFLKNYVLPDLKQGVESGIYGKMHFRGYDPDSEYFRVSDIRSKGEALYRESPFSLIIVDHVLLVDSKRNWRSTTESANEVVRDLKKLSEVFNSGDGLAILALFQISREGKKRADKAQGRYSLYDLSYSNEIERSSDIVTASYLSDDLRKRCRALFQFLKSRDGGMCEPFFSRIEWSSRMLFNCLESPSMGGEGDSGNVESIVSAVESTMFSEL